MSELQDAEAYWIARNRAVRETAEELGVSVDEVARLVDSVVGLGGPPRPTVADTPWEQIRRTPRPPTKLTYYETLQWYRDNAHEVWEDAPPPGGWRYHVLKSYQKDRKAPHARAFCLVDGFESELGDVYWRDILNGKRVR